MGKSKFKVGDKVRFKNKRNGKDVYTISRVIYDEGDQRNIYELKDMPWVLSYSYELEKVDESKTAPMHANKHWPKVILEFDQSPFKDIDSKSAEQLKRIASKITVDDNVVKNRYGDTDIVERCIRLTLKEAQKMYKAGGQAKEFALQVFDEEELNPKPKVPQTWEDYCDNFYPFEKHMHYYPHFAHGFDEDDADALIAYGRLVRLRRAWIGNWRPDWSKETSHKNPKYCIVPTVSEGFTVNKCYNGWITMLSFPTQEMAENFKDCFIDFLIKAENLIF